jgi:lysyl-tRNA synthetase class 2
MRRERDVPNGLNEFLVCETLAFAREHGFERVSLNFAAFGQVLDPPGPIDRVTAVERLVLRRLSGRFQLERLLAFNRKFHPAWTPRYVAYPSRAALPRIGLAAMLAEAYLALPGRRSA